MVLATFERHLNRLQEYKTQQYNILTYCMLHRWSIILVSSWQEYIVAQINITFGSPSLLSFSWTIYVDNFSHISICISTFTYLRTLELVQLKIVVVRMLQVIPELHGAALGFSTSSEMASPAFRPTLTLHHAMFLVCLHVDSIVFPNTRSWSSHTVDDQNWQ